MARGNTFLALAASTLACAAAQANGNWTIIAANIGTFSTGISFNGDGKTGFLAVGANGVGAEVLRSVDGGNTWLKAKEPMELMVLDVTSYGTNVAAMGALAPMYSTDTGKTYNSSTVSTVGMGAGQCIRNLGFHDTPDGFAMVAQLGLFTMDNGVGISTDGGATYTPYNITALTAGVRYGSFPSATNWYVTAGQWPGEGADDQTSSSSGSGSTTSSGGSTTGSGAASKVIRRVNARTSIVSTPAGLRYEHTTAPLRRGGRALQGASGYIAQIAVTADGGNTWTVPFTNTNFYFNGIDCLDDTHCCAAGENDDQTGGFAGIWCTADGNTWNQTYYTNTSGASIMDLRVIGTNGYVAVGGAVDDSTDSSAAAFAVSSDGGATWTVSAVIDDYLATSVDCAQGTGECWATLIDVTTQSASVAYADYSNLI